MGKGWKQTSRFAPAHYLEAKLKQVQDSPHYFRLVEFVLHVVQDVMYLEFIQTITAEYHVFSLRNCRNTSYWISFILFCFNLSICFAVWFNFSFSFWRTKRHLYAFYCQGLSCEKVMGEFFSVITGVVLKMLLLTTWRVQWHLLK